MKHKNPLISVVVLNWNGLEDTKVCLAHLEKIDYPNYEIVVVDNGSIDGSKEYLSQLSNVIYVDNPKNRGFTGGHIDGLRHSSGEFIVLLNNDAVIQKDYLRLALKHFSDPSVGAVGGRSYWWNEENKLLDQTSPFYSYQEINIYTGEAHTQSHDSGVVQEVNNVSGSCVMVRRSVIDELGYLYDRFFAYFEETDLFARLKRADYKVLFDPHLHIWHKNGASSGSSEGSHFFYYQIFRNRFIFATRNFETKFLFRFWFIYVKLTLLALLGILRNKNSVMNRAYVRAAASNLITLPYTLTSRWRLRIMLGKSRYNHKIFSEQSGTSIIIDCSTLRSSALKKLVDNISLDTNPMHEYVLIIRSASNIQLGGNARFVIDVGYFSTPTINLGCLVAKFSWMLIAGVDDLPNSKVIESSVIYSLKNDVQMLGFRNHHHERAGYVFIKKSLFERAGGINDGRELQSALSFMLHYADAIHSLRWQPLPSDDTVTIVHAQLENETRLRLESAVHFDKDLLKSKKIGWIGKLQNKYYRIYQFTSLVKWTFTWRIPVRLKLGRIKNLLSYCLLGKIKLLATEVKHMRNETLIYGKQHSIVERQQEVIKQRLGTALSSPENIPVFIICFERVLALEQLTDWLESRGVKKVVFIDNDSTYQPLLDFYKSTPHQVLQLNRNIGQTSPWSLAIIRALVPEEFYAVTDPDVIPVEECGNDFMSHFLTVHKQFLAYQKVGFGLKTDDLPDHYPLKKAVMDWEDQFWQHPIGKDLYEAGLDTTFALYKPFVYKYMLHPSIRTGGNYVARHVPWYTKPTDVSEEERHYRQRIDPTINSWNVEELPDRYKKELDSIDN